MINQSPCNHRIHGIQEFFFQRTPISPKAEIPERWICFQAEQGLCKDPSSFNAATWSWRVWKTWFLVKDFLWGYFLVSGLGNVANWKFVCFFLMYLGKKVEKMCFFLSGELEYAHLLCGYSTYPTNQALLTIGFP